MTEDTLRLILDKNPGLLSILLTGVLLPLGILLLTNRHNRKQKESDKSLHVRFNSKKHLRIQEKIIYASLSKILFEIQQLHASLSETSDDNEFVINSLKKFDGTIIKYHEDIANNMLYQSSEVINLIYKFYRQINDLKLEVKELTKKQQFDLVPVSIFYFSQKLADILIELQGIFIKERGDLKIHFDKTQQEMMRNCCGQAPAEAIKKKYDQVRHTLTVT
ncbi:MAG: hypothetical protein ABIP51_05410 [Bacteroidia bacterium]